MVIVRYFLSPFLGRSVLLVRYPLMRSQNALQLLCPAFVLVCSFAAAASAYGGGAPKPARSAAATPQSQSLQQAMPNPTADLAGHGSFVTGLCEDRAGSVWVATEDDGVLRYSPGAAAGQRWKQFTIASGLGDNTAYALCCDRLGRIWVGTLNHGVGVYNGESWKSYDLLTGPLGLHVTALATCPTDGDVWMASEGGLTRYSISKDTWSYYTRADGLASDSISAIAFDSAGNLYAGTQCDGISIAGARSGYRSWRTVSSPANLPVTQTGQGLPSSDINALLVTNSGAIFAGTDRGLARSTDAGANWNFVRGCDWADKLAGKPVQSVDEALVSGIEVLPLSDDSSAKATRLAICCGNTTASFASADRDFEGGAAGTTRAKVSTDQVANAAPAYVYQDFRHGRAFKYVITGLTTGAVYTVRLHFTEPAFDQPGKRLFSVTIDQNRVLSNFDIFSAAGGAKNRAVVEDATLSAPATGSIEIDFQGQRRMPGYDAREPILSEDYVSSLAQDDSGDIWVGHRLLGVDKIDPGTFAFLPAPAPSSESGFASSLLPMKNGAVLVGWYSAGATALVAPATSASNPAATTGQAMVGSFPALPASAIPPDISELTSMLRTAARAARAVAPRSSAIIGARSESAANPVTVLDDDWLTEGSWLGRYGRYWACLCAICSPRDYIWGAGWDSIKYFAQIGPNARPGDALRYWVQWLYTNNPRVLELPPVYLDSRVKKGLTTPEKNRREAESDDHGETYPLCQNGPSEFFTVTVPTGKYYLSIYDYNKDGHSGANRNRSYLVSIRRHPDRVALSDISSFPTQPELAHARIVNFWGGVWKRFLVQGPIDLTIEIDRNNSFNTILPAVMLDLVDEQPPPYFGSVDQWKLRHSASIPADAARLIGARENDPIAAGQIFSESEAQAANRVFDLLAAVRDRVNPGWWATAGRTYYVSLMRWYAAQNGGLAPTAKTTGKLASTLGACCYETAMYDPWEALQTKQGIRTARNIEKALTWDGVRDSEIDFKDVMQITNHR